MQQKHWFYRLQKVPNTIIAVLHLHASPPHTAFIHPTTRHLLSPFSPFTNRHTFFSVHANVSALESNGGIRSRSALFISVLQALRPGRDADL
jgi:hypothetical protein